MVQLPLPDNESNEIEPPSKKVPYLQNLITLLSSDLNFHSQDSKYGAHNFHAFPAKFPPQLPRKFILGLTEVGDIVLDPMMGSGTTLIEAVSVGRNGIGFDIDPLADRFLKLYFLIKIPKLPQSVYKFCKG
jgi:DNA modification methylase